MENMTVSIKKMKGDGKPYQASMSWTMPQGQNATTYGSGQNPAEAIGNMFLQLSANKDFPLLNVIYFSEDGNSKVQPKM